MQAERLTVTEMTAADFEREEKIDDLCKIVCDESRTRDERLIAHKEMARLIAERPDHVVEAMEASQGLR